MQQSMFVSIAFLPKFGNAQDLLLNQTHLNMPPIRYIKVVSPDTSFDLID